MGAYQNVLFPASGLVKPIDPGKGKGKLRGCAVCPLDKVKGINKVKGKVHGRKIFVWAQSPGPTENEVGRELVGRAGKYFWYLMGKAGIKREECDIQNVVRCFPADREAGKLVMRDPTDVEIHCCSVYTDKAILSSKAKIHIVLGRIAAVNLLGKQAAKDRNILFWSDKLHGKVIIVDHPSYLLRTGKDPERVKPFLKSLKKARQTSFEAAGKYSYLEKMDYKGITDPEKAKVIAKILTRKARTRRISVDIEDDVLKPGGPRVMLCIGFSYKPGWARTLYIWHPSAEMTLEQRKQMQKIVDGLMVLPGIRKIFQRGSHDVKQILKIRGVKVAGYDWDTNYSEYLKYPGRRSYKLAEIAAVRYPEFAGYKEITFPEAFPPGMTYKKAMDSGEMHLRNLPVKKMTLYNCADADLTKRIELDTASVYPPLLKTYMDVAFTLERMEPNGPFFDYEHKKKLVKLYPPRVQALARKLRVLSGNPHLNPNTPQEIADVLYRKLKLLKPDKKGKTPTGKEVLELIAHKHDFPKYTLAYRRDAKIESTYLESFTKSADMNKGRLRTYWKQTGTATGRLASGGENKSEEGIINLQNVHGDQQLQNLLISDPRWREVYQYLEADDSVNPYDLNIFLTFDYSQIEIRILAQMSGDPEYIKIFNSGEDIHCSVGHAMTGWSIEAISKNAQVRKLVKNIHFGMVYGLQPDGMLRFLLAKGVKTTIGKVTRYMKAYFQRFQGVKALIDRLHKQAEQKGWVGTVFGFRRPLEVSGERAEGSAYWANQAVNSPVQGGAHNLLLIVMQLLHRKPITYQLLRTPSMEVHDALAFIVKLSNLRKAYEVGKKLLEHDVLDVVRNEYKVDWRIPLEAEAKVGFRYGVKVDYESKTKTQDFLTTWAKESKKSDKLLREELQKFESGVL